MGSMLKSKSLIGTIVDAYWRIDSVDLRTKQRKAFYTLVNVCNGMKLERVDKRTLIKIINKETSVSKLQSLRLKRMGKASMKEWWL